MTLARPVLLLAIAGAVVALTVSVANGPTLDKACNADAEGVQTAVYSYRAQTGAFPRDIATLTMPGVNGPWLREAPRSSRYVITLRRGEYVMVRSLTGSGGGDWTRLGAPACTL